MVKVDTADNYFVRLNWLNQFMAGHKGFICGGCFKNIFNGEKVKDIDIFFENMQDWKEAVHYFSVRSTGYKGEDREEPIYNFHYENKKVKAYKHIKSGIVVELCCSIFGTAEQIINRFDFTITKFAYYREEKPIDLEDMLNNKEAEPEIVYKVAFEEKFFEHLHLKRLVVDDKVPFPVSTFERMIRYVRYGYMPCKETKTKIIEEIRKLSDEQVLVSNSLYEGWD